VSRPPPARSPAMPPGRGAKALRRLFPAVLLGLAAQPAQAAPPEYWFVISTTDGARIDYVDAKSITDLGAGQRSASLVRVHEGPDAAEAQSVKYDKMVFAYNCANPGYLLKSIESYSRDGKLISSSSQSNLAWSELSTNEVISADQKFVCGAVSQRPRGSAPIRDDPVANADAVYSVFTPH